MHILSRRNKTIVACAAIALLAGAGYVLSDHTANSSESNSSVEIGLAELSPNGPAGGYAVPASGSAPPPPAPGPLCDLSVPSTVSSGENVTVSWDWQLRTFDGHLGEEQFQMTVSRCAGRTSADCDELFTESASDHIELRREQRCFIFGWPCWSELRPAQWSGNADNTVSTAGVSPGDYTYLGVIVSDSRTTTGLCSARQTVTSPGAATCDSFSVSPSSREYGGGEVELRWRTSNANSVSINKGVGSVSADGSKSVDVDETTTFTLTARGTGGNDSCTAEVTIEPPEEATCDAFSATPDELPYGGGEVELRWRTSNASRVNISGGVGNESPDGSTTVSVNSSKSFTLRAYNEANVRDCSDSVSIDVDPYPPVSANLRVRNLSTGSSWTSSNITVQPEEDIAFRWTSTNATQCSSADFSTGGATSGTQSTITEPYAAESKTYRLVCDDTHSETPAAVRQINVSVASVPPALVALPEQIVDIGDTVTLEWDTNFNNPASCTFTGPGAPGTISTLTGSVDVTIEGESTYVLSCPGGDATVRVQVRPKVFES